MVSTTSCTPPNRGSPSATTSSLLLSMTLGGLRSISRTKRLVVTLAPPSLQMRAATLSTENPRRPRTPTLEHAARWWPKTSKRPHRHRREERGRGRRSRLERSTLKRWESTLVSQVDGAAAKGVPARGPLCDRSMACSCSARVAMRRPLNCSSVLVDASCCHPDLVPPDSKSSGSRSGGRAP